MSKGYDLTVVGGGFAGIFTAWRMAQLGLRVALVEGSDRLGGSLNSFEWEGFWLDHGCHFLDLRFDESARFFEDVLGADLVELDAPRWGVTEDGGWVGGFEFPDFTQKPEFCRAVLAEMAELRARGPLPEEESWLGWFRATRGDLLADAIEPMVAKVAGADPARLSIDARGSLQMFSRVRLGTDEEMIALKGAAPFWDDRLAVTLHARDPRFQGLNTSARFGYPRRQGLHGFGVAAGRRLRELGVDVLMGKGVQKIEAHPAGLSVEVAGDTLSTDQLFWSLPEYALCDLLGMEHGLKSTAVPVGSAFWAFEVEQDAVLGPDYVHDYSARLPFRLNKAGLYGGQVKPDGRTYLEAELPGHPAQLAAFKTPEAREACWDAMLQVGYVAPGATWSNAVSWSLPVAFTLPTTDWRPEYERVQAALAAFSPRVHGIAFGYRGRNAFIQYCLAARAQDRVGKIGSMSDKIIADHYRALLAEHGDDAKAVQYTDAATQEARFAVLASIGDPLTSVLDVGCGLGHLRDYLRGHGWTGRYLGVDIVPEFVAMANARLADDPLAEARVMAAGSFSLPEGFDYVLLSGVFNNARPDNQAFMETMLRAMWAAALKGVAFNAMSTYVDYQDPGLFYTRPEDVFGFCKTALGSHPVLVHDYTVRPAGFPFEYAVLLRKSPRFPAPPVLS